jgi:hypothetical protein
MPMSDRSKLRSAPTPNTRRGRSWCAGEVIRSSWRLPRFGALQLDEPLATISSLIEGRYKIGPGCTLRRAASGSISAPCAESAA